MDELEIQAHDFEESKNQLKKFSEETKADLDLKRVDSEKGVGEFFGDLFLGRGIGTDHIVKGYELNSLISDIQQYLIDNNNMQRSFIKEFGHVYTALESLDKDYIQAILIAVKSAQKANGEAKIAQADIEKTIEEQKKIIKVLQQFKDKLDKFKHIVDIDKMWIELQEYQKNTTSIQNSLTSLKQFKNNMDKSKHLPDVDKMWSDLQKRTEDIESINSLLESQSESITELFSVKEIVDAIEHISDVDKLWQDVQTESKSIDSLEKSVEQLIAKIEEHKNLLNSDKNTLTQITSQKFIYAIDETKENVDEIVQRMDTVCNDSLIMGKTIDDALSRIEKIESINHLFDIDSMYEEIQELKETIANLNETKNSLVEQNTTLSNHIEKLEKSFAKRITIAYALVGGSIGLVIVEFVLALIGLI
ncbi:MAG: hypothetical protein ACI4J6_11785 [Oscillospiraceae bacterium]